MSDKPISGLQAAEGQKQLVGRVLLHMGQARSGDFLKVLTSADQASDGPNEYGLLNDAAILREQRRQLRHNSLPRVDHLVSLVDPRHSR